MNKFEDCIKYYTNMLTNQPKHPQLKEAIYLIGQCNEKLDKPDQAAAFYKKVISIGGSEDDSAIIKAKRALTMLANSAQGA
jgi:TolA-binding protein